MLPLIPQSLFQHACIQQIFSSTFLLSSAGEINKNKMDFVKFLKLKNDNYNSSFSNKTIDSYIDISVHLINMGKNEKAKRILELLGFTKKSINKFVRFAKINADMNVAEEFKLMLQGKVSKKYLN